MSPWPTHPRLYEINAWVWLAELGRKYRRPVDLASVPAAEWNRIASLGFDAIWLMGVWERSPAGIAISMRNPGLVAEFRRALPGFSAPDNVGSPYCVRQYVVDPHLGGTQGLAMAREALRAHGLRLILDFVPNHVAPDHPWVRTHPEYFIRAGATDAARDPASFTEIDGEVFACGRDSFFPAWPDVLQLDAFHPGLRLAAFDTLTTLAHQCDGVRCDMAMLVLNDVFRRTWTGRAGAQPADEYWSTLIPAVKAAHPGFLFIAEAYWDLEWQLQRQGFDFCYDKKLYDRLVHDSAEQVRQHLLADPAYQHRMLRFLENHDEPRAAASFAAGKARAAAVASLTVQGARLLHEGQFEGRTVRLPVFLGRRPEEAVDRDLASFYERLLHATDEDVFRNGEWRLCERSGWPDNQSCLNILAWTWTAGDACFLIVINYGDGAAQARVRVSRAGSDGGRWRLHDVLSGAAYERDGAEMRDPGLYVGLPPWGFHLFRISAP